MPEKRPHENGESSASKRVRSENASPAGATNGANGTAPPARDFIAEARARAAAVKARLGLDKGIPASPSPATTVGSPSTGPGLATGASDADARRARLDALKAKAAAATAKPAQSATPPMPTFQPSEQEDSYNKARGGLGVGLHPALMGDGGQDARAKGRQSVQPRFSTTMGNRRTESPAADANKKGKKKQLDLSGPNMDEIKANPYFDPSLMGAAAASARPRSSRQLIFNQKGKYIQQAAALRRQADLEALKRRIAEQTRKANLDEDNEKAFLVPEPPSVEWWDEGLLVDKDYDGIDQPDKTKIDTEDSIITVYIQHPILIEPPQDKNTPALKPMYLTRTEQRKLRRQRRMAEHKEQQAKIRLGLEPPPPPKVKKSNLMRVLGEQAVKDPTAVEARVNREIAERAAKHQETNDERKLTKEQHHDKLAAQQAGDAARGIYVSVFKVDNLSFGKHRYQIDINAKQNDLTGICVLHPKMNLVIVEGGQHSINNYRKLMLNRVKWTENAMPSSVREGNREMEQKWLQSLDEDGNLRDLTLNKCQLVWEGQERSRVFKKWVGIKVCETDGEARDTLKRSGMDNMWTLAKTLT